MAELRVECLTYAHSRAWPVPSLTSPGYGLPPTVTIPTTRLINIKRPSRLEPRTFQTGTRALTIRSPTLHRLSYGTGKLPLILIYPSTNQSEVNITTHKSTQFTIRLLWQPINADELPNSAFVQQILSLLTLPPLKTLSHHFQHVSIFHSFSCSHSFSFSTTLF